MLESAQAALRRHFGFEQFRPGQQAVIEALLAGHSAAAVFPTGSGKSLCYQLPALVLPGLTLVVSPLIALMKDQIDALEARGIAARRLDSTLDAGEYRAVMDQVRGGQLRLLYVAPERFNNERFREAIKPVRIALFAVDEAHCISEWGHNFRPDYLKLAGFARQCGAERVLALTATATERVLSDICRTLEIAPEHAVRTGFHRPNLSLRTTPVAAEARDATLLAAMHERPAGPSIVYVTLQKTAEALAEQLRAAGLPARAYHAGMPAEARAEVQEWFMGSERAIVVATIAFGMGVDKADIRYVYHYNLPKSLESYSQEIGRAGRDGGPAICEMLVCTDDLNVLENFVYGDTPDPEAIRSLAGELFASGQYFDVSLHSLSARHDIRLLVLRTLLTYLELDGYLEASTPYYADYRFQPRVGSAEILARFVGERRAFLAGLFRQATKARSWLHLDPATAATALGTDRNRVIRALDWLGEQQLLRVEASGVRQRYRCVREPASLDEVAGDLHRRLLEREAAEIRRLQQVLELAAHDGCRTALLAAHFGEVLQAPCGHCSWCEQGASPIPARRHRQIPADLVRELSGLDAEALASPRSMARFLCGISSPRIGRARLGRHPWFGRLAEVPFGEVLAWAERARSTA